MLPQCSGKKCFARPFPASFIGLIDFNRISIQLVRWKERFATLRNHLRSRVPFDIFPENRCFGLRSGM